MKGVVIAFILLIRRQRLHVVIRLSSLAEKNAVRGFFQKWPTRYHGDDADPVWQIEWARSYAYLKNVLTRLPAQKNSTIDELLPHN
jgi:hypothetical protein